MKKLFLALGLLMVWTATALAQQNCVDLQEIDGSPRAPCVRRIKVTNGTLTCSATNDCTLTTGGGGGGSPGGLNTEVQWNDGGAFNGTSGLTATGTTVTIVNGVTATFSRAGLLYTGTVTTDNASVQTMLIQGDRATPAGNDEAYITYRMSNAAGTQTEVARQTWAIPTATAASEDGRIDWSVMTGGALAKELQLAGADLSPSTGSGLSLGTASLPFLNLSLAGYADLGEIAAPANPGANTIRLFADSGTGNLTCLNDAGGNCLPSSSGITVGTTTVTSGTAGRVFYETAGNVVGQIATLTSDGTLVAFAPTVTTGTGATAGVRGTANSLTTGNGFEFSSSSVSSGNVFSIAATGTAAASNTKTALRVATSGANATSTQTTYGAQISNTSTGTGAINVGLMTTASGGSTNYALQLGDSSQSSEFLRGNISGANDPIFEFSNSAISIRAAGATVNHYLSTSSHTMGSDIVFGWDSTTTADSTPDTTLRRHAAGVTRVGGSSTAIGGLLIGAGTDTGTVGSLNVVSTVTTGTGTTAGIQGLFNSLTTGNGLDISSTSVTSGTLANIASTSTAAASNTLKGLNIAISGANGTAAQTVTGAAISVTNTNATSGTNKALVLTASGATTANTALEVTAGNIVASSSALSLGGSITNSSTFDLVPSNVSFTIRVGTNGFYPTSSNTVDLGFASGSFSWKSLQLVGRIGWDNAGTIDLQMRRNAAAHLTFGAADAASPVAQTLSVQNVVGGTTNTAGVTTTIRGSLGTSQGAPGRIHLSGGALIAASGTTQQTAVDRIISGATKVLTNNSATTITNVTVATETNAAGVIDYTVEVTDGTDVQYEVGSVAYGVSNKGGVFSGNTATKFGNHQNTTSGTLSVTFAISGANPALLSVNANSSLTPSTGYPRITYTLRNLTQQAVAVQ